MKQKHQRGVALVITLIMLALITFLAVTFLAMSSRERSAVVASTTQADAELARDAGLSMAKAAVLSRIASRSNLLHFDLMVSRSYIDPNGFNATLPRTINTNNVNFQYAANRPPANNRLSTDESLRNLANLYFAPRVPVYIRTNADTSSPVDSRFYLDFNRNGRYDTNGYSAVLSGAVGPNSVVGFTNLVGDPEWVGILENPEFPHSATNKFKARYAYLVLPVGKTLDINHIHNYGKANFGGRGSDPRMTGLPRDGFLRNQGMGSWEINLGAFFTELNPGIYVSNTLRKTPFFSYSYNPRSGNPNQGLGFNDAWDILGFRYDRDVRNLASARNNFWGLRNPHDLLQDMGDLYTTKARDPQLASGKFSFLSDPDNQTLLDSPYAGSENPTRLVDMQNIFKTALGTNLIRIGTATNTFDRYSYYRLLSQLGTDTDGELQGKINLNYYITNGLPYDASATNFAPWTPISFFTNAAEKMLQAYLVKTNNNFWYLDGVPVPPNFSLTNIQVYAEMPPLAQGQVRSPIEMLTNNLYTPALHRILQLAANLYDATYSSNLPSIFRPIIKPAYNLDGTIDPNRLAINGYEHIPNDSSSTRAADLFDATKWKDLDNSIERGQVRTGGGQFYVEGVPFVIGAKKGHPNFNEFSTQTAVSIARKLQFERPNPNITTLLTNQMQMLTISNRVGIEIWNSYEAPVNNIRLDISCRTRVIVTNTTQTLRTSDFFIRVDRSVPFPVLQGAPRYITSSTTNFMVFSSVSNTLPQSQYAPSTAAKLLTPTNFFYDKGIFPSADIGVLVSNRVRCIITVSNQIVDIVTFNQFGDVINLDNELSKGPTGGGQFPAGDARRVWNPRVSNSPGPRSNLSIPTDGVQEQILISMGYRDITENEWRSYNRQINDKEKSQETFKNLINNTPAPGPGGLPQANPPRLFEAPFEPAVTFVSAKTYQANDPLVHYTVGDLFHPKLLVVTDMIPEALAKSQNVFLGTVRNNLGRLNTRYEPWNYVDSPADSKTNLYFKDALVTRSDDWNFPTNKFPNVGWMGRVHRGTPWQTISFKPLSPNVTNTANAPESLQSWIKNWTLSVATYPTNDWRLADLFTTAISENAAKGTLSVNQSGQAAWSAVLSGIQVLQPPPGPYGPGSPPPAAYNFFQIDPSTPELTAIVAGINRHRALASNEVFQSIGDIFGVPELTTHSPYLRNFSPYAINDAAYESIPQQILSLVKLGQPRLVVYAYGQSLLPAQNSISSAAGFVGMCTNYQVMGESAARYVISVEGTWHNPKTAIERLNDLPAE